MLKQLIFIAVFLTLQFVNVKAAACPVEDDPTNLARCVQVDVTAIVYAARGKDDITSLCAMADRYMECFKTYTRGCVGFHFGEGSLTELQNIALYCCRGVDSSPDCPFNAKVKKCFNDESYVTLSNGERKILKDVVVGDKVKTLDANGHLIDTDIIMLMDKSNEKSLFFNIKTYSNKNLAVSATHLIAVPGGFKFAKRLMKDDAILSYDYAKKAQVEEKIESIMIEPIEGYSAPLTEAGTILVNDVLASCYATIESHSIAHSVMAPARLWHSANKGISYLMDTNFAASTQANGTHWYPELLYTFTDAYLTSFLKVH